MSGYHAVTLPPKYSAGSIMSVGYDTRVVSLESGIEERVARYSPWGRRKYTILRGIASREDILELYEFFMLRQGSLNAFRFWDPFDHSTTSTRTRYTDGDPVTTDQDTLLVHIEDRRYQAVVRYTDSVRTIVRPITKIGERDDALGVPSEGTYSINNSFTSDRTVDTETGIITFGGETTITFAEGGFDFLVPVRFADNTDRALQIAMQSTIETQELPGIDLIEDLDPRTTSQDYQYGGSRDWGTLTGNIQTSEINGRVQAFTPDAAGHEVFLPPLEYVPDGGPIFVFRNLSSEFGLDIVSNTAGTLLFQMGADSVLQVYVATVGGIKRWIFFG